MFRLTSIFLLCALGAAQNPAAPAPSPNTSPSLSPSTTSAGALNQSENAKKARTLLDQTIQALGGQAYLTYQSKGETGRYYPLYHGRTESSGIPYNLFSKYPDKDRFEVIHQRNIFLLYGSVSDVKVKNKSDIVVIHNGDKGYEITYKGTASQEPIDLEKYLRRRAHSIESVFRKWMQDPEIALFYDGASVVDSKETEGVTLLNRQNDSVTVYLDQNTHYPIKISYSWRDPNDKQKNTEEEIYDNYKLVQGIWTAHSITRYYNGETSLQRFVATASYDLKLPDSAFEAAVTYDPKAPPKKR